MTPARLVLYRAMFRAIEITGLSDHLTDRGAADFALRTETDRSALGHRLELGRPVTAWFHAASAGEIESLWSVAIAWVSATQSRARGVVLTCFSPSGVRSLSRLAEELTGIAPAAVLHLGYSPWEGAWGREFKRWNPSVFVTAKYEAWPDLWAALAEKAIPLVILGARDRVSLRIASAACRILGSDRPKLHLLASDAEELRNLRGRFPFAETIQAPGDPRWDRVHERARKGNPRAREWLEAFRDRPRPWGILGSAWAEDIEVWRGSWAAPGGTIWVVPHDVGRSNVESLRALLSDEGLAVRTLAEPGGKAVREPSCVLVDEMGFLSELYSACDWVYVGGGFGEGVHSTIEPAIHGVPIAAGPEGAGKFSEVAQLRRQGQLTLVEDADDLRRWAGQLASLRSRSEEWRVANAARQGATERVLRVVSACAP